MTIARWFWLMSLVATGLILLLVMFWRLDVQPIQNWDESIHGQVSREMVESGDWLDLSYRGELYFRKPPLKFWLTGLTMLAFGDNAWTLRLWSALAGLGTNLLICLWARQLWRSRWLALVATLVFASGPFVFSHAFRTGETDGLLVFWVTLALYGLWRAKTDSRWLLLFGVNTGLAIMTKSAGGLLPVVIFLVEAIVSRSWPFRWRHVVVAVGLGLLIAAPWHLVELVRHGDRFWQDYAGLHVFERATTALHNQGVGTLWYVGQFAKNFFPWSAFFPFALVWAWRRRRSVLGLPLVWFAVTFIFFSVFRTKFDWYLLPLYPAAALILTPWLMTVLERPTRWVSLAHAVSIFGVFLMLPRLLHPDSVLRWSVPLTYLTGLKITLPYLGVAAGLSLLAWWLLMNRRLSIIAGALVLTHLVFLGIGGSLLRIRSQRVDSPLPPLVQAVQDRKATTLYTKGVDLVHYPAAYWYFRGIPGVALIDLERQFEPFDFSPSGVAIVRDPSLPPAGDWTEVGRVEDFRVLTPRPGENRSGPSTPNPLP